MNLEEKNKLKQAPQEKCKDYLFDLCPDPKYEENFTVSNMPAPETKYSCKLLNNNDIYYFISLNPSKLSEIDVGKVYIMVIC
jgi:hypothetical protein